MPDQKIELVKGGRKVDGVFEATPTAPKNNVITPASLEPASVINVPKTPIATGQTAMLASFEADDAFTKALTDTRAQAETTKNDALTNYINSLTSQKGLQTLTNEAYATPGGVNDITPELNDINDQIRREQLALRRATERIQERGGGLEMGANSEINNLERVSFAKQADLSVIQMAAQGRYDSAKEQADRAVAAKFEQQTLYTNALKTMYDDAKDQFTTAEQREFESALADRNQRIADARQLQSDIYNMAIEAQRDGAPVSLVQQAMKAQTRDEAMGYIGGYLGALDRQAKLASISASNLSARKSLVDLAQSGDPSAISQLGFDPRQLSGNDSQLLAYAQQYAAEGKIPTGLKEAGVKFGDIATLAKTLPQPTGAVVSANTGVKDNTIPAAQQDDYTRLYNIVEMTKRLEQLDEGRYKGLVAGTLGQVFGNDQLNSYLTTRKAIVDEIARMQTGAALTKDEQAFYNDYLPGANANPAFLGVDSTEKIKEFGRLMEQKLSNGLSSNGLAIYGYSPVQIGDQTVRVGDVLESESYGRVRVNADGSLTQLGI